MASEQVALYSFNRGILSPLALARTDLKRTALSAQVMTNFMPRLLGSMMLRPGLGYVDSTFNNAQAVHVPFIFSTSDMAIIELTNDAMRVRVDEDVITRVSVASAITNGTFSGSLSGWTNADQTGATSTWAAGNFMSLTGNGFNAAMQYQQVTVASGDQNKEHALRIVVNYGKVNLNVGSTLGAGDYIATTQLHEGTHSLAFTPTGNFYVEFSSYTLYPTLVAACTIEAAGVMVLPTPWPLASLPLVRWDQSADVIFLACDGYQQQRIERRATRSWSIVLDLPEDGPFRLWNTTQTSLTPSAISGSITLTASQPVFFAEHVGALYRITSTGQLVTQTASGANQFSNPVEVTGIGSQRALTINISGTWVGTVTLQYSVASPGAWVDVTTFTTNQTNYVYTDGLDNQIIYYRLGIETGHYTSGSAALSLSFASGSITGIARITGYTSPTSVTADVLTPFGNTTASTTWAEGAWSNYQGWPTSVTFFEGRLWWAGRDNIWGSVSDAFDSFDDTTVGDSGPISRSIGSGPVDVINWILPLLRLVLGGQVAEHSIHTDTIDDPVTPTNFALRSATTRGSCAVPAVKIDMGGVYAQRGTTRLIQLTIQNAYYSYDYDANDLSLLCPEVLAAGITRIAVQRLPDTRIHCVLANGQVAVLVFDPAEDVKCWVNVTVGGSQAGAAVVEDVFVLPGEAEDTVYYSVNRTINGQTVRYLERWALESECVGGTQNKQADSFVLYSGSPTTTLSVPSLTGETVVVWADGIYQGTFTATGGIVTLPQAVSNAVTGLAYTAQFQSAKLAYAAQGGTALTQRKRIDHLGVIMQNTHYQGLQYGTDFDTLDDLPLVENGTTTPSNTVWGAYDADAFEFNGEFSTDSRLCLQANAPLPCTLLAAVMSISTYEKA